ncbi:MAG TPA: hypothetical protein VEQ37_18295 [Actinomycetota bacterium]|nr:hypothetical protein [Actinomycetota bacterium]
MGTATILVVDDEHKIRDLVRSYFEREGYSVLVAGHGSAGTRGVRIPLGTSVLQDSFTASSREGSGVRTERRR